MGKLRHGCYKTSVVIASPKDQVPWPSISFLLCFAGDSGTIRVCEQRAWKLHRDVHSRELTCFLCHHLLPKSIPCFQHEPAWHNDLGS